MIGTKALTLAVLLTAAGLSAPAAAGSTPLRSHVVRGDIQQLERAIRFHHHRRLMNHGFPLLRFH